MKGTKIPGSFMISLVSLESDSSSFLFLRSVWTADLLFLLSLSAERFFKKPIKERTWQAGRLQPWFLYRLPATASERHEVERRPGLFLFLQASFWTWALFLWLVDRKREERRCNLSTIMKRILAPLVSVLKRKALNCNCFPKTRNRVKVVPISFLDVEWNRIGLERLSGTPFKRMTQFSMIQKERNVHGKLNASWKICSLAFNGQPFLVIDGYLLNPSAWLETAWRWGFLKTCCPKLENEGVDYNSFSFSAFILRRKYRLVHNSGIP